MVMSMDRIREALGRPSVIAGQDQPKIMVLDQADLKALLDGAAIVPSSGTQEGRQLMTDLSAIREGLSTLVAKAAEPYVAATYPSGQALLPLPAGRLHIDLHTATAVHRLQDGTRHLVPDLNIAESVLEKAKSLVFYVDSPAWVTIQPGQGGVYLLGGFIDVPVRQIDAIEVWLDTPANFAFGVGTSPQQFKNWITEPVQLRTCSELVKKTNPAGTADAWTALTWVPTTPVPHADQAFGLSSLDASLGSKTLRLPAWGTRTFEVRSGTGTAVVELRCVIASAISVASQLGWRMDPDTTVMALGTSEPDDAVWIESSIHTGVCQLQARVAAAEAANATEMVVASMIANSLATR